MGVSCSSGIYHWPNTLALIHGNCLQCCALYLPVDIFENSFSFSSLCFLWCFSSFLVFAPVLFTPEVNSLFQTHNLTSVFLPCFVPHCCLLFFVLVGQNSEVCLGTLGGAGCVQVDCELRAIRAHPSSPRFNTYAWGVGGWVGGWSKSPNMTLLQVPEMCHRSF